MYISRSTSTLVAILAIYGLADAFKSPALRVKRGFLSPTEIALLASADIDGDSSSTYYGQSVLNADIVKRLPRDRSNSPSYVYSDGSVPIMTTALVQSSPRHSDCHMEEHNEGTPITDEVAFIFLNTNPHANFVHGDIEVPVVAGDLVTFKGAVEHNTVIKKGYVHLAGPFHLSSVAYSNMEADDLDDECTTREDCTSGLCVRGQCVSVSCTEGTCLTNKDCSHNEDDVCVVPSIGRKLMFEARDRAVSSLRALAKLDCPGTCEPKDSST